MSFTLLVAGIAHETPQQVVTRYNNYKAICNGIGFEKVNCKDPKIDTIAFQSTLTKHLVNLKSHETVIFEKVSLNEGKAYDKTSGIFTAPSDGIYSFTWTTLTKTGKTFITDIVRNGEMIIRNFSDGRGRDGYAMSTSHANIKMKKGDKVWIRAHGTWGQYADGGEWCFFSGVKL
ncbi:heavy metal-binding protein HIP-like [Crassostrea angulata]|uniref:heavy metal-binding protein HIP-like n=1 Tax=Magallana angulata TaxID=2784310 RepID=UPI0022B1E509|nr:heavy metal-binding protein HIP-like [Crassostrea angulata]